MPTPSDPKDQPDIPGLRPAHLKKLEEEAYDLWKLQQQDKELKANIEAEEDGHDEIKDLKARLAETKARIEALRMKRPAIADLETKRERLKKRIDGQAERVYAILSKIDAKDKAVATKAYEAAIVTGKERVKVKWKIGVDEEAEKKKGEEEAA